MVRVRLKIDIAAIEEMPQLAIKTIKEVVNRNREDLEFLARYSRRSITLFLVYFGDTNLEYINKEGYSEQVINCFDREVSVKIHLFYISRLALFNTFKRVSRLT